MYYHVQPSPNVVVDFDTYPKNLDQAVSMVIKAQGKYYRQGELITEGHVILGSDEENDGNILEKREFRADKNGLIEL